MGKWTKRTHMMEPIQIFLVDADEKALAETRSTLLDDKVHHRLHHARNGDDALVLLNTLFPAVGKPVLLLISNDLLDMKVIDLVEKIRQNPEWKQRRWFQLVTPDYASAHMLYKQLAI